MPAPAPPARTPYRVKLHHLESCSCDVGCNCQFGGYPAPGYCEFVVAFQVIDGHFGDVKLDGVTFVLACKYPKAIHEGNGHVALFVDAKARPEQVNALAGILSGAQGGMPWEALAGTVGRLDGPFVTPIEIKVDGRSSRVRIPGSLEVQWTPLTDNVSGEEKEVHIVYPKGGFLWNEGSICTTQTMRVAHGDLRFEHPGHYSAIAVAEWKNTA